MSTNSTGPWVQWISLRGDAVDGFEELVVVGVVGERQRVVDPQRYLVRGSMAQPVGAIETVRPRPARRKEFMPRGRVMMAEG